MDTPQQLLTDMRRALADLPERLALLLAIQRPTIAPSATREEPVTTEAKPKEEGQEESSGAGDLDKLTGAFAKMGGIVPQLGELAAQLRKIQSFMEGLNDLKELFSPKGKSQPSVPSGTDDKPLEGEVMPGEQQPPWVRPVPPEAKDAEWEPMRKPVEQLPYRPADVPKPPLPLQLSSTAGGGAVEPPHDVPSPSGQRQQENGGVESASDNNKTASGQRQGSPWEVPSPPMPSVENQEEQPAAPKKTFGRGEEEDMPSTEATEKTDGLAEAIAALTEAVKSLDRKIGKAESKSNPEPQRANGPPRPSSGPRAGSGAPTSSGKPHAVERSESTLNFGEQMGGVLGKGGSAEAGGATAEAVPIVPV